MRTNIIITIIIAINTIFYNNINDIINCNNSISHSRRSRSRL